MNEVIKRDYRKKDNLKWFNDNYFISVYDENDNNIMSFENIETPTKVFNIELKKILEAIRKNARLEYKGNILKLVVYKKEPIKEAVRRR